MDITIITIQYKFDWVMGRYNELVNGCFYWLYKPTNNNDV